MPRIITKQTSKIAIIVIILLLLLSVVLGLVLSGTIKINVNGPKCVIAGCSGELCVDENDTSSPRMSICIWSDEFECYQKTTCEVQSDGKCGWTQNDAFNVCMSNTDNIPDFIPY